MKKMIVILPIVILTTFVSSTAFAHFGMLIPSDSMVMQGESRTVVLNLSFSHPMEMVGMVMVKPKFFGLIAGGKKKDLTGSLKETKIMGQKSWKADYKISAPGAHVFYMEPAPYWEPAEDCFIIHYTKCVVAAFGDDEGWDEEAGLKTEIVPLAKPFGLYTGNVFQGIVKLDGKPVPYAEVEVEYYNKDGKAEAPTEYMITQTIKADKNGVFTYGVPKAGWWGFAALNSSDEKIKHNGEEKDIELGAVIWVQFHEWHSK